MQDNESLREFVKRFGQAVLQVEAYSMDSVLQIFKRSIYPGTPFFESLAKKPPKMMDGLFRRASKYSMLEDDVRAATQQILVAGQASRSGAERSAKLPNRPRPSDRRQEGPSHSELPPLTPISISYEKLLPMIQDMSDFRWPRPLGTDPSKRDHSKKCAYHKEHGHTTEACKSLHYLVERLIKAGHLKQYLRSDARDPTRILQPHRDALIMSLEIGDFDVRRILVDLGSSAYLVQASVISHMGRSLTGLENPGQILSGFNGASTTSLGDIVLPVQAGPVTLNVQFFVVQDLSPFNVILGRTWLHYMKAIPSTYHQMVSFLTKDGQIDLYGSQLAARQCYQIAQEQSLSPTDKDPPVADPLQTIQILEEGTHLTYISSLLTPEKTRNIQNALRQSHDVFAWAHSDMKGIHPSIVSHRLNVLPTTRPVRQKVRRFHPDRQKIIQDEIEKLLGAGFIKEVEYPDWLANVVVVPKKEDQIVDSTAGQGMLSFLDAFSEYHQIPMAPVDEEKTSFITLHGLYCYKVMPFGLKNAGATYQRLMTKIFKPLVGLTVERCSVLLPLAQGAETYLLRQQGVSRRRTRYSKVELMALALRSAAQKLRPYFQAHPVVVLTDQPLRNILHKPDLIGRMLQWAIELSEFGIQFQPRLSMKGQVMADFVLEYSRRPIQRKEPSEKEWWTLLVDGASRSSGSGVGLLLQSPTGEHLEQAIRLGFPASNNEAEYEAILSGLDLALALSISSLQVYSDSQLVVRHVQKEYEAKDARMARYLTKVRDTLQRFTEWTIEKIKRTKNGRADALAGIAASLPIKEAILLPIHVQANP
ncbi:uncharacterized protein LOC117910982 [Vitis riparia]|uniref:uncharacterized protein LOC117910982 n=1 Tax=Vitis riparia TaxID=96939 RepID=UPI00155A8D26|nr:uncharacterized protein LOC117910982 [Vitis riparia]